MISYANDHMRLRVVQDRSFVSIEVAPLFIQLKSPKLVAEEWIAAQHLLEFLGKPHPEYFDHLVPLIEKNYSQIRECLDASQYPSFRKAFDRYMKERLIRRYPRGTRLVVLGDFLSECSDSTLFLPPILQGTKRLTVGILSWAGKDRSNWFAKSVEFKYLALRWSLRGDEPGSTFSVSEGVSLAEMDLVFRGDEPDFIAFTLDLNYPIILRRVSLEHFAAAKLEERLWTLDGFLKWSGLDNAAVAHSLMP